MVFQLKKYGDRERYDCQAGNYVEDGCAVSELRDVDAVSASFRDPDFTDRCALENADEECGDVDVDDEDDGTPY